MPYTTCACGVEFWREPHEAWKTACLNCYRDSQDENSPRRLANLKLALNWAEQELGRRQDMALAFQVHIPAMLAALEHLDDPKSRRCRLWLLQLLIPEDGHFDLEFSLALDRAQVAVEEAQ